MLIYHQCGHNFIWNIQALQDDGIGEGLIISPVNVEADRIQSRIPDDIIKSSMFDPQFYLPNDPKNKLASYPFFPGNILDDFTTADFESHAHAVAEQCLAFQKGLGLRYHVIPTRFYDDIPEGYLNQLEAMFVEPFLNARSALGLTEPALLTVIAKRLQLEPGIARDELLSWVTGFEGVSGIYLILDHNTPSKQIKDADLLANALRFVNAIRSNDMEVHLGYSGVEGLLLSVADPTSISVGSYENLRSFGTLRLETREKVDRRGPRPRIYSAPLLQSIEDQYLPPMRQLMEDWTNLFDDSPYKEYLLDPGSSLSFQRSEVYKHYFHSFQQQVAALPPVEERNGYLRERVQSAITLFSKIQEANVFLDADSDGSHLPAWMNALAMYEAQPE